MSIVTIEFKMKLKNFTEITGEMRNQKNQFQNNLLYSKELCWVEFYTG